MKDAKRYILVLLMCFVIVAFSAVYIFIPKAAAITLPYRWDHVPLGQQRFVALQYLGKPFDSIQHTSDHDMWIAKRDNGEYTLTIYYRLSPDTVANRYQLDFVYKLGFFKKTYHLKNEQLDE